MLGSNALVLPYEIHGVDPSARIATLTVKSEPTSISSLLESVCLSVLLDLSELRRCGDHFGTIGC